MFGFGAISKIIKERWEFTRSMAASSNNKKAQNPDAQKLFKPV